MRRLAAICSLPAALLLLAGRPPAADFPRDLDSYFTKYVKLDAAMRAQLLAGAPVTRLLDSDASKEVVVFGAVWIDAPVERYLAAVRDIERFESGGNFRITKKISSPPAPADFAALRLSDEDAKDLRTCKVADCQVKLAQSNIERIQREVDWSRPDAHQQLDRIARETALSFVNAYLQGGNQQLAVYRDASRPTFVAQEFAEMIDRLPSIGEFLPEVRKYLLEFPRATLAGGESFLYWQEAIFGLKPTIRINHVVMAEEPGGAMVASKMIYASHYFWTALELRVLLRDPSRGNGFWFVTESRSRSDGLSGFTGRVIRGKVRGEAEKGTQSVLQVTRDRLQGK